MMKKILLSIIPLIVINAPLFAQKTISEGTISYNIQIQSKDKTNAVADSAISIIYLKGNLSRTEMKNSLGNEATILDTKTGNAVILKQYSGQKLMITLSKEDWNSKYSKYNGIVFQSTNETKKIAGYTCKKTTAQLKDGTSFIIYYTQEIIPFNKEYDPVFKSLPGLPVQYEFYTGALVFRYTLSSINFNTIPSAQFDIPKSGYRVMTYKNQ
jgi:GLPGLI family protein